MQKTIRRILTLIPAVILQIFWIFILIKWLAPWATFISVLLSVASLIFVLFIYTDREETTYKLLWIIIILSFPIAGAVLYILARPARIGRPIERSLEKVSLDISPDLEAKWELEEDDLRLFQTMNRLEEQTGCPITFNEKSQYFSVGEEMFSSLILDLSKAKNSIFMEYFIIKDGYMWQEIKQILQDKAGQGLDVRVIYDDFGSFSTFSNEDLEELRRTGIKMLPFNRLLFLKGTLNYRDHRKIAVIDSKVAYSGGINISDEYINEDIRFGHWKDIGFRIEGPGAKNYNSMFLQFWNAFSEDRDQDIKTKLNGEGIKPDYRDGWILSYYDSPVKKADVSNDLYIELLALAKEHVFFYTPYLMLGDAFYDSVIRAAERGVDVRIMMPGKPDKDFIFRMSRSFYPTLLEAGVKIYEYEPGFLHAKACSVDGRIAAIGTVNLDYRSLFLHFENNSIFYKSKIIEELEQDMLETQVKSREIILGQDIKPTFFRWLYDGILRLLAPLC